MKVIAYGVWLAVATWIGIYSVDWIDRPILGDLLLILGGVLAIDALFSWMLGYFPWEIWRALA